jgi:hypothetical protein
MITALRPCALSPATSAVDPAIHPLTRFRALLTMPRSRSREIVASPPGLLGDDLQPFPTASRWRGRALLLPENVALGRLVIAGVRRPGHPSKGGPTFEFLTEPLTGLYLRTGFP